MVDKDALEVSLIADFGGVDQAEPVGAALHEEREDLRVFKLVCDHVRGLGPSETKYVNGPPGLRIMLGEIAFTNSSANRLGVVVENALDEREITDGGCHQDIGLGAAGDEKARNIVPIRLSPFQVLPRTSHVLCGGRFMVDVASVDVGPVVEQQSGDLNGGSEMEWQLAVTATCMHELRISGREFADTVDSPKSRGGMDIDDCAARDEIV